MINEQLAQLAARTGDPRRLAVSAHEIGHALGELVGGADPEYPVSDLAEVTR